MSTIQVRAEHTSSTYAYDQIDGRYGIDEVDDAVAVTIAALWQSPGTVGSHLASLATGAPTDVSELLDDIAATRRAEGRWISPSDRRALDMLATWVLQRTTNNTRDYAPQGPTPTVRYVSIVALQGDDGVAALDILGSRGAAGLRDFLLSWYDAPSVPYMAATHVPGLGTEDRHWQDGDMIIYWNARVGYCGLVIRLTQ